MQRFSHDEQYEREPLDPSQHTYDSPYRPGRQLPSYDQTEPPYSDATPPYSSDPHPPNINRQSPPQSPPQQPDPEAPPPPRHGDRSYLARGVSQRPPNRRSHLDPQPSNITPGADNFSESAAGGMAGIAYNVADRNARESGVQALRSTGQVLPPPSRTQPNTPRSTYSARHSTYYPPGHPSYGQELIDRDSRSSLNPFGTATASSGGSRSSSQSPHISRGSLYGEDLHQSYSGPSRLGPSSLGIVDPNDIEDDGDDGLEYGRHSHRGSMLTASASDRANRPPMGAAAAMSSRAGANRQRGEFEPSRVEKSEWQEQEARRKKRRRWMIIALVLFVIIGAIVGAVVGTVIKDSKSRDKNHSSSTSDGDDDDGNTDLNSNSVEIKKLMNNPKLHKVFPGVDYTPMNTQYPDCKKNPPSQNNVTRDVAVLSQMTNTLRLYGNDCNQTQMILHSIKQLKLENDMKLWLGVWQDNDEDTNARQLKEMYNILDDYGATPFEGVIVANEIIYRKQMTVAALGDLLSEVRTKLKAKNIDLPVGTADLGDSWTADLAEQSDYVMANVHPFFSGTPADESAAWTWNFYDVHDAQFKSDPSKNIISETGWPTSGGKDCGDGPEDCSPGAVAGVDGLNRFMKDFVCQSLANGTNYFWFSPFDEPWKIRYNEKGKEWEDKWGLMDVDRNVKDGVEIPDCDGKTV